MVYKLINEWKSKDGSAHEITIYKYNLSHDEVIRYNYEKGDDYVSFKSQCFGHESGMIECNIPNFKYRMLKDEEEIALVKIGEWIKNGTWCYLYWRWRNTFSKLSW